MLIFSAAAALPPVNHCAQRAPIFYQSDRVFERVFEHIVKVEGVGVAPPDKSKRISKFGITAGALGDYLGEKRVKDSQIRGLSLEEAKSFYYEVYWKKMMLNRIKHPATAIAVFDQMINRGPRGGTLFLQKFLNEHRGVKVIVETGLMTLELIELINDLESGRFILAFFKYVQRRYTHEVRKDPQQFQYWLGWMQRTYEILDLLLQLEELMRL